MEYKQETCLDRHFPDGAASTAWTTPRTFNTTILEVESTSYRSFARSFSAEKGLEPVFRGMMTQQCSQESISLSISNPAIDFTNRLGSSHPRQLNQSVNPSQYGREQIPCDRHFRHLEAGVAGMPHHFRSDLDERDLQVAQGPVVDRPGQSKATPVDAEFFRSRPPPRRRGGCSRSFHGPAPPRGQKPPLAPRHRPGFRARAPGGAPVVFALRCRDRHPSAGSIQNAPGRNAATAPAGRRDTIFMTASQIGDWFTAADASEARSKVAG